MTASASGGLRLILIATAIAGLAGYLLNWLIPAFRGPITVVGFTTFWSALYLVVSALAGIQQELTRATHPRAENERAGKKNAARDFAVVVSASVLVITAATGALWVPVVMPGQPWYLAIPLAIALASYVLVATLSGTLYGIKRWSAIAWLIGLDGVLRLVAVGIALLLGADTFGLAWAVALPFPLAAGIVWFRIRASVVGTSDVDVSVRALSWNVIRTVVAGAATGVIISGFPFLFTATSHGANETVLASLLVLINLTRAPLIIPALALQSYLVVRFRDAGARLARELTVFIGGLIVVAIVLGLLAMVIGPWLLETVFQGKYYADPITIAFLVASAGFTGALCISGPATLARASHAAFTSGWVMAALVTVAMLFVPVDVSLKAILALSIGPAVGLLVHLVALRASFRGDAEAPSA